MKKFRIIAILFAFSLFIVGCENTNEDLVQQRGENVMPVISNLDPASFTTDVENSYIYFTVSLPDGESVDAASIEVATDSSSAVLQTIGSFPANITVKVSDAATALGIPLDNIVPGCVFYVYVLTEKNGNTTRSAAAALTINVFCAFLTDLTIGSYHEVCADWYVEGDVTITADASDPYKVYIAGMQSVEGLTNITDNTVALTIDPGTYALSGGTTVFAPDLSEWDLLYTNYAFTFVSGSYDPCTGIYEVTFSINTDQVGWGEFTFTFTQN